MYIHTYTHTHTHTHTTQKNVCIDIVHGYIATDRRTRTHIGIELHHPLGVSLNKLMEPLKR